jgi:hypothetical protein
LLISEFAKHVPLVDKHPAHGGWEAKCARCGADVSFGGMETIEYLVIKPAGAADIGAPMKPPLPLCRAWRCNYSGYESFMRAADKIYRAATDEEWLAWLRA